MSVPIFPSLIAEASIRNNVTNSTEFNYERLSILFATKYFFMILFSPISGFLIEYFNSRTILFVGSVFQAFTLLSCGFSKSYFILLSSRVFEAISSTTVNTSSSALVVELFTDFKIRCFLNSASKLSFCIAGSISPLISGVLYHYYGTMGCFLSYLIVVVPTSLLALYVLVQYYIDLKRNNTEHNCIGVEVSQDDVALSLINLHVQSAKVTEDVHNKNITVAEVLSFLRSPLFLVLLTYFPTIAVTKLVLYASLSQYMSLRFNANNINQGSIWLSTLVGNLIGFFLGNVLNARFSQHRHLVLFLCGQLHSVALITVPIMPIWWAIAVPLGVMLLVQMIMQPCVFTLAAVVTEQRHHSRFGIMAGYISLTLALSATLGSYLGPILLQRCGFLTLNLTMYLIGLLYSFGSLYLRKIL